MMQYSYRALADIPALPESWEAFTNLHGTVYYTYDDRRLLTTDDMRDFGMRDQMLDVYYEWNDLFEEIDDDGGPHDAEMFVFHAGGQAQIRYASWKRGRMYDFLPEGGIAPGEALRFWDYAWQFVAHRTSFPPYMAAQFVIRFGSGSNRNLEPNFDITTLSANESVLHPKQATCPFDAEQSERLMQVYRQLRGKQSVVPAPIVPALAYHVSRTMFRIEAARVQASRVQPLHDDTAPPSWRMVILDLVLTVVFCGTHTTYQVRLERAVPRRSFAVSDFRRLMQELVAEWGDSNLVAALLVSVNVSFLGVEGIMRLQRTSALASALLATVSLAMGLHHIWQHRARHTADPDDVHRYLFHPRLSLFAFGPRRTPGPHGAAPTARDLVPTACALALPRAALRWAVLGFALAAGRSLLVLLVPGAFVLFWAAYSFADAESVGIVARLRAAHSACRRNMGPGERGATRALRMDVLRRGVSAV
ncbi:hypothetical protein B0H15DRAFT_951042 [Mycena belliarum]|uniref:WW domain-containing protein n=1 Tax=Mycena belliarum TaxID=1033014 RepID=A0AAD6U1W0_9AGAR|nr:hypothetical protein B0H15DRAFT_951042 [Mycena belliae]